MKRAFKELSIDVSTIDGEHWEGFLICNNQQLSVVCCAQAKNFGRAFLKKIKALTKAVKSDLGITSLK